jgi:hypothetical protein
MGDAASRSGYALLRRGSADADPRRAQQPFTRSGLTSATRRRLLCAACRHPITTEQQRIEVNGRHKHRCVNPDGLLFHIGCFRGAPGCTAEGVPTTEFTWFAGYAWNYALCNRCSALLGWKFQGSDSPSFFGLILNRLAPERERPH